MDTNTLIAAGYESPGCDIVELAPADPMLNSYEISPIVIEDEEEW